MKTFKQFLDEAVEASNSIKGLSPYKTMNQGTTDEKGNFRYIKRLYKKVQAVPKKFGKNDSIPTKSITDPNVRDKNTDNTNPIKKIKV